MILLILIGILIIAADQISKYFVESFLYGKQHFIIENFFSLTYVQNRGAAWGILNNHEWIFKILVPLLLIGIIVYLIKYATGRLEKISGVMIISGALGNYIDRIFRGYVVDFFDFLVWPVFNIADISIVAGCILMCFSVAFCKKNEIVNSINKKD